MNSHVDGELDGFHVSEIEQHLDRCQDCKLEYSSRLTLRSSFKDKSLYHCAPPSLRKRIRSSLQKEARVDVTSRMTLRSLSIRHNEGS
jgi:hypothetical protein